MQSLPQLSPSKEGEGEKKDTKPQIPFSQPSNNATPIPAANEPSVKISIIQQPIRSRMCGINTGLGKRLLDPPLVVRLTSHPSILSKTHDESGQDGPPTALCIVSICLPNTTSSIGLCKSVKDVYARDGTFKVRTGAPLIGQTCKTSKYYSMSTGSLPEPVFVFQDLSVRLNGAFILKCTCFDLTRGVVDVQYTDVFEVYMPQHFPGLTEPTQLSKLLYIQGVNVRAGLYANSKAELERKIRGTSMPQDDATPSTSRDDTEPEK